MSEKDFKSRRDMLKGADAVALGVAATSVLPATKVSAAKKAKKRWAFVVDLRRCVGCRTCTVSCKSEFNVPLGRWRAVIKTVDWGKYPDNRRAFVSRLCNHCAGEVGIKGQPESYPFPTHHASHQVLHETRMFDDHESIRYIYSYYFRVCYGS